MTGSSTALAVELPVILLEIVVFHLYVGRCTACHSVRDHCFFLLYVGVELPVILRQTMISSRMAGSTTANIQKKNNDL
jgi:hypothetical protein